MSSHLNLLSFARYSRLPFLLGLMGSLHFWSQESLPCQLHVLSHDFPDWLNRHLESYERVSLQPLVHLESGSETAGEHVGPITPLADLILMLEYGAKFFERSSEPLVVLPGDFLVTGDLSTLAGGEFDVVLSTSLNHVLYLNRAKHLGEGVAPSLFLPALYCHPSPGSLRFLQDWIERLKELKARLQENQCFSRGVLVQIVSDSLKEALERGLSEHKLVVGTPTSPRNTFVSKDSPKHLGVYPLGFPVTHSGAGVMDYWKAFQEGASSPFEFGPSYIDHLVLERWYTDVLYGS